jgi:hypothetical protein
MASAQPPTQKTASKIEKETGLVLKWANEDHTKCL